MRDVRAAMRTPRLARDRKSTRLNSSHGSISYAVFCLKKKIPEVARQAVLRRVAHPPAALQRADRVEERRFRGQLHSAVRCLTHLALRLLATLGVPRPL